MINKDKFHEILLGHVTESSGIERSRILFSASTIVVIILSSIFFLAYDLYLGYPISLLVYTLFIVLFTYALRLLRIGKYDDGLCLLLVGLNIFIYLIMSSIPEDSMSAIFYIGIIVVEYVLLGGEKKVRLFLLLSLSFAIYLIDAFIDFSLLPTRSYDDVTLQVNKVVDFIICAIVILITIKLLIDYLKTIIEERTKTNAELQRLNKELDKYAYTITHDIKGPIQSMQSFIDLLENDHSNINEYLSMMRQNFINLSNLVEDVAERARSRNFEVKKEVFNVRESVEIIWELSRHNSDAMGIDFLVEMPEEFLIKTDKSRITGILNNLITNSIAYHDKSKNNPFIKVSGYLKDDFLFFSVEDNGIGIDSEYKEKVFEMFYRASNKQGGSGLGLFTVKELVDELSGQIELESSQGEKTVFSVKIPNVSTDE
ncbi:MAG: ATP-binding protein [Ekhidna sp.]